MYRFIVETAANSDNVRTGAKMLTIICALKLFSMVEKISNVSNTSQLSVNSVP